MAFLHNPALADFERFAFLRHWHAEAFTARIAQRARPVVDCGCCCDHVHKFGFVCRSHQDEPGQAAKISDVECAGMGRPVGADQAGAVDGEADRQPLDGDVVHHLVIGALQEGGIDRGKRLETFGGETACKGHPVLLGDADVEAAIWEILLRTDRGRCPTASPQ